MEWRIVWARATSRVKRRTLGVLLWLSRGPASDPAAMLSRFSDESLMPLRRIGLDPVPELAAANERCPVTRLTLPLGLRGWLVTGYDETRAVLGAGPQTFSNDFTNMVGKVGIAADQDPGGLGFTDPPQHTRLRHLLMPHFTTRALAVWAPRIAQIVDDALDELAREGADGATVDLQRHFSTQIASRTIMELLGVPDSEREQFQRFSTARFDVGAGAAGSLDVIGEAVDYLVKIVAEQRHSPAGGLIGEILREHGDDIDDLELAGLVDGVLTGGLETTVSMLSLGTVVLLQRPDLAESIRAEGAHAHAFVEELLRYLTVVQIGFPRFARHDMMLGGHQLLAGDVVIPSLIAANRDHRHSEMLDDIRLDRDAHGHLAFGHGLHRCVGAELARLELRLAYPALTRRFPHLRLAIEADQLAYRDLSIVYGLAELPVVLA